MPASPPETEPKLRAVTADDARRAAAEGGGPRDAQRIAVVLAIGLAIALALLAWSRVQLSGEITALEDEVRMLEREVADQQTVIDAQRARIDDVRVRVRELVDVLEEPLPTSD